MPDIASTNEPVTVTITNPRGDRVIFRGVRSCEWRTLRSARSDQAVLVISARLPEYYCGALQPELAVKADDQFDPGDPVLVEAAFHRQNPDNSSLVTVDTGGFYLDVDKKRVRPLHKGGASCGPESGSVNSPAPTPDC